MKLDMAQREMGKDPSQFVPIKYGSADDNQPIPSINFLIGGMFVLLLLRLYRQTHGKGKGGSSKSASNRGSGMGGMGGMSDLMNMSKSGATVYGVEKKIRTRFKHVAGLSNAK